MASGRTVVTSLVAILLAAIGVAAVILFLLPSNQTPQQSPATTSQRLDTSVLQRSDYTGLDTSLLQQGALPVQPPPTTGKANPFL